MLVPVNTDRRYWHDYVRPFATALCFLKGRVKFLPGPGEESPHHARFPSCFVYFGRNIERFIYYFDPLGHVIASPSPSDFLQLRGNVHGSSVGHESSTSPQQP
jgi:hypothetical protein